MGAEGSASGTPPPPALRATFFRLQQSETMESISVFDIFKIGIGPSSSHTMGPWRAARRFTDELRRRGRLDDVHAVSCELFGSLAKTGRGHGTDLAVILGLSGEDPVTCDPLLLDAKVGAVRGSAHVRLAGSRTVRFDPEHDVHFHRGRSLPFHANAMTLHADLAGGEHVSETYYSIGGGFIVQENEEASGSRAARLPFPIDHAGQIEAYCREQQTTVARLVRRNERTWRPDTEIDAGLIRIWRTMLACMHAGCHRRGILPGGLEVRRRAADLHDGLLRTRAYESIVDPDQRLDAWASQIRGQPSSFRETLNWVSTFALAVNEENASFSRVVTAPTNGAAGVIPAVLMYYWCFCPESTSAGDSGVVDFLLTAGEIGSLFKKGATISAAMGGCQAEIGVSSAMAAAGLTQVLGGDVGQVLMAAEIAMEHHLGMTCDPIAGLVQIPCIERNTMGAVKAITAAMMALVGDPRKARVTLDDVIKTMWATAQDMQSKYKETAEGGLAVHVGISEC
jgi:L-serine dehydratase